MLASPEEVLTEWGDDIRVETKLCGGTRTDVWAVWVNGRPFALRRTRRSREALAWELNLVEFLRSNGIGAPSVLRTKRGDRTVGPFFMESWVEGHPPDTEAEWRKVEHTLRRIHQLTTSWPQRPTFASVVELLTQDRGGDVDLSVMPPDAVKVCREAWRALSNDPVSAIHGDPRGNVLVTGAGVVLIDWDEARFDASVLDLADLPIADLATTEARRAASAWEAAASWVLEPEYARKRLADLY